MCSLLVWDPWHWRRGLSVNMTWFEWCTAAFTLRERPSLLRTGTVAVPPVVNRGGQFWHHEYDEIAVVKTHCAECSLLNEGWKRFSFWIQRNGSATGWSVITGGITTMNHTWALWMSFSNFYLFISTQSFSLSHILFFLMRKTLIRPQSRCSHAASPESFLGSYIFCCVWMVIWAL